MFSFFSKNFQRRRLLAKNQHKVMQHFLSIPFPIKKNLIKSTGIVSLDIETTGLNPHEDKILSIGLVEVENFAINLESSWHQIVQSPSNISAQSVTIHQITDDQTSAGMSLEQALAILFEKLSGKVMLVHNATVEQGFINEACKQLYGCKFIIPTIDTQALAQRSFERANESYKANDLRLFNLRKRFNMPNYKAHNALMDAIATAELFLALANKISPDKNKAYLAEFLS